MVAMREAKGGRIASNLALRTISLLAVLFAFGVSRNAHADWWSENVEFHGKATSTTYFNSPSLSHDFQLDQWWNEVDLHADVKLYDTEGAGLSFHTIISPTYDLAYDLQPKLLGDRREAASPGTQVAGNAWKAMTGKGFPGHGACINGAF